MAIAIERAQAVKNKTWPLPLIIAWLIWRRNRIGICVAVGGSVVGAILAHTVLAGSLSGLNGTHITLATFFRPRTSGNNRIDGSLLLWTLEIAFYYLQYISFIALRISWVWTYDRTKVALYPQHLLRAPATTMGLAVWPILCGIIISTSFWLFEVQMVFRPMGYSAPFASIAVALSLMTVLYAASNWSKSPGLQAIFVLCYTCSLAFAATSFASPFSTGIGLWAFILGCAALGGAVKGLGAQRCEAGSSEGLSSLKWLKHLEKRNLKTPASPLAALVDIDRGGTRSTSAAGWVMMLVMAIILPLLIDAFCRAINVGIPNKARFDVDGSLGMVAFMLFLFGITPAVTSVMPGLVDSKQYILSRPLSTQVIAAAKLWSVICSATRSAFAIVILLACSAIWQIHRISPHDQSQDLGVGNAPAEITKIALTCALLSIMAVYRWSINISVSAQASNKFQALVTLLIDYISSAIFFFIAWFLSGYTQLGAVVFVCSVAVVKLIVGILSVQKLVRSRIIDTHGLVIAGLSWIAAAAIVYTALSFALPKNVSDPAPLCALTLIVMPLVRLSLGPICSIVTGIVKEVL